MTGDAPKEWFDGFHGQMLLHEPMAKHTSLKVGGPADYFAIPADLADLQGLLGMVGAKSIPFLIIGGGYNLLIRDGGFRGVVISLSRLSRIDPVAGMSIRAEAGASNVQLVSRAAGQGLTGLEFLAGIPGTVGGALSVNAGAHGASVMELVDTLVTLRDGQIIEEPASVRNYGYRYLELQPGEIVIAAKFSLKADAPAAITAKIEQFRQHRQEHQRVTFPNAGSFFKNPKDQPAWRLIDMAGLRGYCVGGAQVSEAHANFLVNRGGATAADFIQLAAVIKKTVFQRSGVALEEEVRIFGEI